MKNLTLLCGPMFAGKTTALLERYTEAPDDAVLFRPAFDTRYSHTDICTHDGRRFQANTLSSPQDLETLSPRPPAVFIDEVQFLEPPNFNGDLCAAITPLLNAGVEVTCAGLDLNWRGATFHATTALSRMAGHIVSLTARCAVCGRDARYTFKRSGSDKDVELGAGDTYEPRCTRHFYTFDDLAPPRTRARAHNDNRREALRPDMHGLPLFQRRPEDGI